ncbi:M28 family peptidase [Chryseobacterium sp. ES2]|uniref:M28 family peptidase n=1 Tax=Chryseobacterium metallicongregator TaxID=3073042 RepID=A0ABU1E5T0_9FLAO|nr:M28 family peptidase [Chryseobacterium sp. ES2]MDR4953118.1 M28 family peptidase [Chryseobacterium sp. ES2]
MNFKNIKPTRKKLFLFVGLFVITGVFLLGSIKKNRSVPSSTVIADASLVKKHLMALTQTPQFRNHKNIDQLNAVADYIHQTFATYVDNTTFQEYKVDGKVYKNVITSFGPENAKRIIIGAHYDVCGDQQGADDNATGVTALLELARMLKGQKLKYRVDLVAYTLEEPPYFRTENFITLVKKMTGAGPFVRNFIGNFKDSKQIKTETFSAPKFVAGIDYSDHLNYWNFEIPALIITDTSFFRNKNYHETTDTLETLDTKRMTKVIDAIFLSIIHLKGKKIF